MLNTDSAAAAIFSQGPETVIAASHAIIAGAPAQLTKRIDQHTLGDPAIPAAWTMTGTLENPRRLKGPDGGRKPPKAFFQRREKASFAIMDSSTPDWELELGSVEQAAAVVLFFREANLEEMRVLPSPKAGPDLVKLVTDVVRIQGIAAEPDRIDAWADYAASAPWTEGRKAALRSLASSSAPWRRLDPVWRKSLREPSASREVRVFAFLLLVHCVTQQRWPKDLEHLIKLILETFSEETDPSLAFSYTDGLGMLHSAAQEKPHHFPGVAAAVAAALRSRPTLGPDTDEHTRSVNEAYQRMREQVLAGE